MLVGVEIGGTKLQVGVGAADGSLHGEILRLDVDPKKHAEGIRAQLATAVAACAAKNGVSVERVARIGVGFGGPVDASAGRIIKSHQIAGWEDFPITEWFEEQFQKPTVLGNDSDLAGWAEALLGAGRGAETVVYSNIGSGIGGAFVRRGDLYTGQGIGAAEIGHLRMAPTQTGSPWKTLEELASGWALDRVAVEVLGTSSATAVGLADAAERGEERALAAWMQAVEWWGVAFANVATLLCPERIVVGGGVALQGDFLLRPLREVFRRNIFPPFADRCDVVLAKLRETMVVQGALLLAGRSGD
jgi:glucokinase